MNKVDTTRITRQDSHSCDLHQPELSFVTEEHFFMCRGIIVSLRFYKLSPFWFDVWLDGRYSKELSSFRLSFSSLAQSLMFAYNRLRAHGYNLDGLRHASFRARARRYTDHLKMKQYFL